MKKQLKKKTAGKKPDYIFIARSAKESVPSCFNGFEPFVFDVSSGRGGLSRLLLSRIRSGQKQFLFIADPKISRQTLKEEVPLWLQEIREKALDCDFHYAGTGLGKSLQLQKGRKNA